MNNRWFIIVALLLSALWYPILLMIPTHRDFIWSELLNPKGAGLTHFEIVFLLCVAGLTVALIFRRKIILASGWGNVLLGCVLPYVATALFLVLLSAYASLLTGYFRDFFVLIFWGMLYTLFWLPLIGVIGIGMQFALRWAGRHNNSFNRTRI
jgi:hypothetical protein